MLSGLAVRFENGRAIEPWCESFKIWCKKGNRVMSRSSFGILFLLCATPIGWAQQVARVGGENFVPAGTLLYCTLSEPNFSSKTAQVGDPVLCHTDSVSMFGRSVIPRGSYLTARLQEFRDPGHFVGKGWIQLEFTGLTVPAGNFPLNAKVISASHYRVDGEGKVHGRGHPTRDAIEWTIPILWPVKVLTLPARGPRPTFKGETRIGLRLMEDIYIPEGPNAPSNGLTTRSEAVWPRNLPRPEPQPSAEHYQTMRVPSQAQPAAAQPVLTFLCLRGGHVYRVVDYWVDNGHLDYTTIGGTPHSLPLDALDMATTSRLNAEQGVHFVLAAKKF
jgi:hypothetical protein